MKKKALFFIIILLCASVTGNTYTKSKTLKKHSTSSKSKISAKKSSTAKKTSTKTATGTSKPRATPENTFFVSTKGLDSNSGTEEYPWKTIQKAANTLIPGSTVYIKPGIYKEKIVINVSGAPGKLITFRNYQDGMVTISGKNVPGENSIYMHNKSYIRIIGLKISDNSTKSPQAVPKGIFIDGYGTHIEIRNNNIRNISAAKDESANAHGIAVYGNNAEKSINNIIIDNNIIYNCKLGRSEALALNGNVEEFRVSRNTVRGHDNIGIDFIGFERTCQNPDFDQARNGVCRDNSVSSIDSYPNPGYKGERAAAGIYVDGGKDIIIERNKVFNCNYGIEVGCEHAGRITKNITVRDNFIYFCHITGISFGGYSKDVGRVKDCYFFNNTLYNNRVLNAPNNQYGEVNIQWASTCTFKNNIFYIVKPIKGTSLFGISNWDVGSYRNIIFDYNIWYTPQGAGKLTFIMDSKEITGFPNWQSAGFDKNSLFMHPELRDTSGYPPNLHLRTTSKSKDTGDPSFFVDEEETDIDGQPRIKDGRINCGADE